MQSDQIQSVYAAILII